MSKKVRDQAVALVAMVHDTPAQEDGKQKEENTLISAEDEKRSQSVPKSSELVFGRPRSRRRKRRIGNITSQAQQSKRTLDIEQFQDCHFLGPVSFPMKNWSAGPLLHQLKEREYGRLHTTRAAAWQRGLLQRSSSVERISWKSFALQRWNFTSLETPISEAVLGLDLSGSMALAVGQCQAADGPQLMLRCYGLPSPSVYLKRGVAIRQSRKNLIVSPNLLTVPLDASFAHNDESYDEALVTTTAIKFLLSSDGCLGMAILRPGVPQDVGSPLGSTSTHYPVNVVVFAMPRKQQSDVVVSMRLSNVSFPVAPFTYRKYLAPDASSPGVYISVIDASDAFLLTWFSLQGCRSPEIDSLPRTGPYVIEEKHEWEEIYSDRRTGAELMDDSMGESLSIVREARIDILALRSEILSRHRHLSCRQDYYYDLVKLHGSSKVLLVLTLILSSGRAVGVVLRLDLVSQNLRELVWVKATSAVVDYQRWTNMVGRNWLAREMDLVGKDSNSKQPKGRSNVYVENRYEYDPTQRTMKIGLIQYEALYPGCFVLDNTAVMAEKPVLRIRCQAPVELVYG